MTLGIEDNIKGQLKDSNDLFFFLVNNISKLLTGKVKHVESSDFHAAGIKWRLLIEPSDDTENHLSFHLWITDEKCTGSDWEVRFSYKLSLVSQTGQDDFCERFAGLRYEKKRRGALVKNFISYNLLLQEKFVKNDEAIFSVKIWNVKSSFTDIPKSMGTAERIKLIDVPRNNCRFTWKITQFSSFIGESHRSYEFTVGPRRWQLEMCPNGKSKGKGNSFSLYLNASDHVTNGPKGRTLAVYKLRVLDQIHRNHYETTHQHWFDYDPAGIKSSFGCPKWLPLEELYNSSRGFLVNDQIYVGVEFLIVSTSEYL